MGFLCVSDQIDPLIYSTTVRDRYADVDAVFCAGDLSMEYVDFIVDSLCKPTFFIFGNHDLSEYKYYKKTAFGEINDEEKDHLGKHGHGADYASNRIIRNKYLRFTSPEGKTSPLLIAGITGSLRYNNGQAQFTESQMKRQLIAMIPSLLWNKIRYGRYCDVFLAHASPRHIHDKEDPCHKGFECFNWFIKKFSPSLFIHGHIHLYDLHAKRVTVTGKTTVINAYSHLVVDFEPNFIKGGNFESRISILTDR